MSLVHQYDANGKCVRLHRCRSARCVSCNYKNSNVDIMERDTDGIYRCQICNWRIATVLFEKLVHSEHSQLEPITEDNVVPIEVGTLNPHSATLSIGGVQIGTFGKVEYKDKGHRWPY